MAESLTMKPRSSGLERLSVPSWGGSPKSYATWKKEFKDWMVKYGQDSDEELQRFRKAMPKDSWWTKQLKTCKTFSIAWGILDKEFGNMRKLMDELLADINNYSSVKSDPRSLTRYATAISVFVSNMENGCSVQYASEAPFFMSRLLSKLEPKDNADFGREIERAKKEENVTNLIDCLHKESCLRS